MKTLTIAAILSFFAVNSFALQIRHPAHELDLLDHNKVVLKLEITADGDIDSE